MRKMTRSTRWYLSPSNRRVTRVVGIAMIRFLRRSMLRLDLRKWKLRSASTPTTVTGVSPTRSVCPSASPLGKKTLTASVPSTATGEAESMSWRVKARPCSTS